MQHYSIAYKPTVLTCITVTHCTPILYNPADVYTTTSTTPVGARDWGQGAVDRGDERGPRLPAAAGAVRRHHLPGLQGILRH